MKNKFSILGVALLLIFASCEKQEIEKDGSEAVSGGTGSESNLFGEQTFAAGGKQAVLNFRAHLSGDQEVPANNSRATGQAVFQLSKDGAELSYKLIVANILNVRMAHIHLAPAGANGGVVAWLYPPLPLPSQSRGAPAASCRRALSLPPTWSGLWRVWNSKS
jgi:hypothetical protein